MKQITFTLVATLALIVRSGTAMPAPPALSTSDPEPGSRSVAFAVEGDSLDPNLYWPPHPQLLAHPEAPGNRTWWDTRFAYRRAVLLDVFARRAPAGRAVEFLWDGDAVVREGAARADGRRTTGSSPPDRAGGAAGGRRRGTRSRSSPRARRRRAGCRPR